MFVLAIETSTSQGSVAIAKIEQSRCTLLFSKSWLRQKSHGELVTPAIEDALNSTGLQITAIDAFGVSNGPGSFTGIRVGINTIKSLAYALDKPIYVFNSLELLAAATPVNKTKISLVALINAHKSQCYTAVYRPSPSGWRVSKKPQALTVDKLEKTVSSPHICVGEGYDFFASSFSKSLSRKLLRDGLLADYPSAVTIVQIIALSKKHPKPKSWKDIEPLYIRSSEAEEKLKVGLLKPLPEY